MMNYCWYLLFAFIAIGPTSAFADVDIGSWEDVDALSETSSPLAEALANQLSAGLRKEMSQRIFLNVVGCKPSVEAEGVWCANFISALQTFLIRKEIRFLGEAEAAAMRIKIAEEQMYQHNSMMVDVTKAVELGKQNAVQAFVTVEVAGDSSIVSASAQSVSIKDGVVTVKERVTMKVRSEKVRPWGVAFKGVTMMGIGSALTTAAIIKGNEEKKKGDSYYTDYKNADDKETATTLRKKSEAQDGKVNGYYAAAGIAACFGLYGLYYFNSNDADSLEYRIDLTQSRSSDFDFQAMKLAPAYSWDFAGLVLTLEW